MIKLNKSTRFALYAMVELGRRPDEVISAKQVADKYRISEHHVVKVLQQLARAGFVRSIRGINGGFLLAANPKSVTMLDIIRVTEPIPPNNQCVLLEEGENCDYSDACRIGEVLNEIQEQAYYTLKSVSLATLLTSRHITG